MDNYEVLEVIHASRTSETIILKVKEKNKRICDKVYALKLIGSLNNRFQKLIFKREVDALKTLNSCDNIVKIRDYMLNAEFRGKNDWGLILLDYVDGTNLEELDLSNFSQVEKYELCLKILKAIEEAHNNNVLHRDIKPSNIMYNIETGEVKIIDFDAAKIYKMYSEKDTRTVGTIGYAAPEQYGEAQSDERTDIYGLGIMMNVMLTGKHPVNEMATGKIGNIIEKCIMVNPSKRYRDVMEVKEKLNKLRY
jgi:serine/threonine protein kinase